MAYMCEFDMVRMKNVLRTSITRDCCRGRWLFHVCVYLVYITPFAGDHAWRRELSGARVQVGRRQPDRLRKGEGRLRLGCGWVSIYHFVHINMKSYT